MQRHTFPKEKIHTVEILVHAPSKGCPLGHVDIVLNDLVLSYGNYDHDISNIRLFGLTWDGVLTICEKQPYLSLLTGQYGRTILCYRLSLNAEDLSAIREKTRALANACRPWNVNKKSAYAQNLAQYGATTLKVGQGPFRLYSVLRTNCALLCEQLVQCTSLPRLRAKHKHFTFHNIVSFLNSEMLTSGSPVYACKVYRSDTLPVQGEVATAYGRP